MSETIRSVHIDPPHGHGLASITMTLCISYYSFIIILQLERDTAPVLSNMTLGWPRHSTVTLHPHWHGLQQTLIPGLDLQQIRIRVRHSHLVLGADQNWVRIL